MRYAQINSASQNKTGSDFSHASRNYLHFNCGNIFHLIKKWCHEAVNFLLCYSETSIWVIQFVNTHAPCWRQLSQHVHCLLLQLQIVKLGAYIQNRIFSFDESNSKVSFCISIIVFCLACAVQCAREQSCMRIVFQWCVCVLSGGLREPHELQHYTEFWVIFM